MNLHDLLDPIYDPIDTDELDLPWDPADLSIGGEGGGE